MRRLLRPFVVAVVLWIPVFPTGISSQTPPATPIDVGAALDCFVRHYDSARGGECRPGEPRAEQVLHYPFTSRSDVIRLLDGLETLAISHADSDVRRMAVLVMGVYGRELPRDPDFSGVVQLPVAARLANVFRSADWMLKRDIVNVVTSLREKAAAAALLREALLTAYPEDAGNDMALWPHMVGGLQFLGAPGRAILADLDSKALIADPRARDHVSILVARNFQPHPQERPPQPPIR